MEKNKLGLTGKLLIENALINTFKLYDLQTRKDILL